MPTVTLTAQNFQEHVEKPGILLIGWSTALIFAILRGAVPTDARY